MAKGDGQLNGLTKWILGMTVALVLMGIAWGKASQTIWFNSRQSSENKKNIEVNASCTRKNELQFVKAVNTIEKINASQMRLYEEQKDIKRRLKIVEKRQEKEHR